MSKSIKKSICYIAAFIIPVFILVIVSRQQEFYPFGDKTLFLMDMKGQYLEFFASLRNAVHGDNSIFYSWSRSMGGNYVGLFAYYIASPLSFITIFFPIKKLALAIWILTLLKIGLCGISFMGMARYIAMRGHKDKECDDIVNIMLIALSVSYALISYNMVYSLCLMWLDGVIFLPFIIWGMEKLLDASSRGLHLMIGLAGLFICNYYTGYMVGVFCGIYFLYRVLTTVKVCDVKECAVKAMRFAVSTVFALGISAPLILPTIKDLMQGKLGMETYTPDTTTNFVLSSLLDKLHTGVYDSITNSGLPSIYCGFLAIGLALIYFVVRDISIREKVGSAAVLVMIVLSFYFTKVDIAWHGFKYPTWFPYRYAFVFSFFVIYMACRAVVSIKSVKVNAISYAVAGVLAVAVCYELAMNASAMFAGLDGEFVYGTTEEYTAFLDKTEPLVDTVQDSDDSFYRINQNFEYSKNDAMLLGYNGMTHYSSTFNQAVNSLTSMFGIAQAHIWNSGYGTTPLLDSLFDVKYIMDDGLVPNCYTKVADSTGASVYSNDMYVPVVYSADASNLSPDFSSGNPFVNQNTLLNTIAGTEASYFTDVAYTYADVDGGWTYTFSAADSNPVYLYMDTDSVAWADIYVNGNSVGNYFSTETTCNLYLGSFNAGDQVTVQCIPSGEVCVNAAYIDSLTMDALRSVLTQLQQNGMDITSHSGGKLKGTIDVEDGQTIMTSIPYDEGWTVKVDGKKVDVQKYANTFMAVSVSAGEHTITFSYVAPGFTKGLIICIIVLIISTVYFMPDNRRNKMIGSVRAKITAN